MLALPTANIGGDIAEFTDEQIETGDIEPLRLGFHAQFDEAMLLVDFLYEC